MIKELITMLQELDPSVVVKAKMLLHAAPRVFFIGNGGSAAIASHMAIDYSKNGNVPAMTFNDPAALTCLANDFGYEQVFSRQIDRHMRVGDVVVLISSSGKSPNIIKAAERVKVGLGIPITLTGFDHDNPLRRLGHINFYVPSNDYGVVEVAHLAILHSMVAP